MSDYPTDLFGNKMVMTAFGWQPDGRELKRKGMEAAASTLEAKAWLELARFAAWQVCKEKGECTSDDVRQRMILNGHPQQPPTPNVYGSIFKDSTYEFTGKRVMSTLSSNHGREIKVWKLKECYK